MRDLRSKARPDQLEGMARFAIVGEGRLGVSIPDLRKIAKGFGKDHTLALALWKTGIPDARILASMVEDPERVTERQMDAWVKAFNSWDLCDQVCMNLFDKTPHAWKKTLEWSRRDEQFVRRAAFALIACLAWHDKGASDTKFLRFLPVIKRAATDDRNFAAKEIQRIDSRPARWIASDAIRELESKAVQRRLKE
jgi:3-methyladenine DNA glycosylase AlkD